MHFRFFEAQLNGTDLPETLFGGDRGDLIFALGGNDSVEAGFGDDTIDGGDGEDTLRGGNNEDLLIGGLGNDSIDGGADNDTAAGGMGDDTAFGGMGDDLLFGGNGADLIDGGRNNDSLAGNLGADTLRGDTGEDSLYGGAQNDMLEGGDGNDFLAGGFGADRLIGGRGNDVLLSRADAGEPEIAQDPGAARYRPDNFAANDTLTGGTGADLFRFELVVNAPEEVAEAYAGRDGSINWGGVTGENDGIHDHWMDAIGTDVITDFSLAEGDRIQIVGHTVRIRVSIEDCDGDGLADDTCIDLYSDQGPNGGAHHMDELGHIHLLNAILLATQITVDPHRTYGAYDKVGQWPHRFEDAGLRLDNSRDWRFSQEYPGLLRQGGAGDESLSGGLLDDSLFGAAGADTLRGGDGCDIADGGVGNDVLFGGLDEDLLLGGDGADTLDGGADADKLAGGAGRDSLLGGTGDDHLMGGADADILDGGRNDDSLAGQEGNDILRGNSGDDDLWGGEGNDTLDGGDGNDFLAGGFGADRLIGGRGNDTLLSRADAGEPEIAQLPGESRITDDNFAASDTLTGGAGADLFRFELVLNAPEEVAATHADSNGWIRWGSVAGENDGVHDHWVDSIGIDVITDFSAAQGDRIEIAGHTVRARLGVADLDADGLMDDTRIELWSDQGPNGGAHHRDRLGEIHVLNALLEASQISVDDHPTYGAYDRLGEGPHRFEDSGLWQNDWRDWGWQLVA
jgi:Ca2+-binding RTX toxin-like protein